MAAIQTINLLFKIAENSANLLFLVKDRITVIIECEKREKNENSTLLFRIFTNRILIWQRWHHFCNLNVATIHLRSLIYLSSSLVVYHLARQRGCKKSLFNIYNPNKISTNPNSTAFRSESTLSLGGVGAKPPPWFWNF